jgi:beta-lactamase class A
LTAAVVLAGCASVQPDDRVIRGPRDGLTHPLLDVEPEHEFHEYRPFRYRLQEMIAAARKRGDLEAASVYFRDLDDGPVVGVDDARPFRPASLLKLPIMIGYLKAHESEPDVLRRRLVCRPEPPQPARQFFPPKSPLVPGRSYTIDELLTATISRSDNGAVHTLIADMTEHDYASVYGDLGLRLPNVRDLDDPVTVREYASFFRILYNASYLSKAMSERALRYLAASDFDAGLVAGVPPGTIVAHKFGEYGNPQGVRELHDCGIVYHPRSPYLLCVMTKGRDLEKQAGVIAGISRYVYAKFGGPRGKP